MKRKFTASAIYVVMLLSIFIDPIYAVTMNDLPVHEINVVEDEKKVLDETIEEVSISVTKVPVAKIDVHAPVAVRETSVNKSRFTPKEIDLLERLVHAEAGGEPFLGKVAVANVVLNRVKSKKFPNTISEVIYAKNQFSPIWDGRIKNKPSDESKLAVKSAIEGQKAVPDGIAFFYEPSSAQTNWIARNKTFYGKIGKHKFYYE